MEDQNSNDYESYEINLLYVFQALMRHWYIILVCAILFGVGSLVCSKLFITPLYSATVKMYVNNDNADVDVYLSNNELSAAKELVDTYLAIFETPDTMKAIIQKAELPFGTGQLLSMLSYGSVNATQVFYITVTSADPKEAESIANVICEVLPERIAQIIDKSSVRIVQKAELPTGMSSPNYFRNTVIGILIGAFLSCAAIVLIELLTNTIRDENYPCNNYGVRTLAYIPNPYEKYGETKDKKGKNKNKLPPAHFREMNILCNNMPYGVAEAYKVLRTNLNNISVDGKNYHVLGITSPCPQEGKSTLAINYAYTLAQSGKRVLLMEADMRKPVIAKRLSLKTRRGLSDMLLGGSKNFIQDSNILENWKVLCAGTATNNTLEFLSGNMIDSLLDRLRQEFDYILVDLPPINLVSDAMAISRYLDGIIFAVKQDETTKNELKIAMQYMMYSQTELVGFVITNAHFTKRYGKYRYYSYGYRSGGQ